MSAAPTWSDVINAFTNALINVMKAVGDAISQNAGAVATALIGIGMASAVVLVLRRYFPGIFRFIGLA
jgi:hypothetical protein